MKASLSGLSVLALSILAALACAAPAARAQDTADATDENKKPEPATLGETVVTAQKREEVLQNVPLTIAALPEQLLRDSGVRDIKDMQILVSNLSVTSTSNESQTTARIRGVGTVGDNPGLESSVGIVIDGVYRPRNGVGFGDLGEIERIEVLSGPQGTLYGKNTSSGLINVITRRPEFDRNADAELTFGNYGAVGGSAAYNDTLGEHAAFRLYAVRRERDGFTDLNDGAGPSTQSEDGTQDYHSFRGQLLLQPNDDLDFTLIADKTERDEACCAAVTILRGPSAVLVNALAGGQGVIGAADPERRLAYNNRRTDSDLDDQGISVEANWLTPWLDHAKLTSITAYRDWRTTVGGDLDYSGADIWFRPRGENLSSTTFETFSQELRLTGSSDRLDWMLGYFHTDENNSYGFPITLGGAYESYLSLALINNIAANLARAGVTVNTANGAAFLSEAAGRPFGTTYVGESQRDKFKQQSTADALFTNLTWHATDALDMTLGVRYTHEEKELDSLYQTPNGGLGCTAALTNPNRVAAALIARGVPAAVVGGIVPTVIGNMCLPWSNGLYNNLSTHQERSEGEWSGTLKAAYRFNEHWLAYLSGSRGYKAGGFNQDRELRANLTPDLDTQFPGEFVNAYELGAKTTWLDGNLLLNAALFQQTYSDFQLNTFLGTSFVVRSIPQLRSRGLDSEMIWQPRRGVLLQVGATYLNSKYGDDVLADAGLALLPGNTASFAPRWSTSASFTYEHDVGSLLGRFNIGARHLTEYNTGSDLDPNKVQDPYTLVNARVSLGAQDNAWVVELWAQNLTDETYKQVAFNAPLQTGSINAFLAAPRTYGLTLRASF